MGFKSDKSFQGVTLIVFLLGIFMGAIDTGIVSPARVVIQGNLGISDSTGVWMITIYSLFYAVSMPIVSKFSDIYGRKKVYLFSITVFGIGSLLCGLSSYFNSYEFLLISRVIQAVGGGGIMPIATAFIGQSFPENKKGSALGYVGAVFGVATMLGPTLGSAILSLFGNENWGFIFFINVPITIIILILGFRLEENKANANNKLEITGILFISIVILSLMYALSNISFFDIPTTIKNTNVYPFLIIFLVALPIFIYIETRAKDPVIKLKYFKNKEISLTLIIGFISGCTLMATVFIPQFAENILGIKMGTGGYIVTLMSIFSGIAAPLGGKLVDKKSAKMVLVIGFMSTIIGSLVLAFLAIEYMKFIFVFIGLVFVGIGIGLTMGTPLNYIILTNTNKKDAASALSTLSLIRSIGVTISPNIMINFIAKAGSEVPASLQAVLPPLDFKGVEGIDRYIGKVKTQSMNVDGDIIGKFKEADVTTVFNTVKEFMSSLIDKISNGINKGVVSSLKESLIGNGNADNIIEKASSQITNSLEIYKTSYMNSLLENEQNIIEAFRNTINNGFKEMFIFSSIAGLVGLLLVLMLKGKNTKIE